MIKNQSADEALANIKSNERVFIQGGAATPSLLVKAVTTRAHVHYVVTEFGIADLYGKNIAQRAKALIAIAHPEHREELEQKAFELYG